MLVAKLKDESKVKVEVGTVLQAYYPCVSYHMMLTKNDNGSYKLTTITKRSEVDVAVFYHEDMNEVKAVEAVSAWLAKAFPKSDTTRLSQGFDWDFLDLELKATSVYTY